MYKIGRQFEYYIKQKLKKEGALVIRSAGSHSPFDLIAIKPDGIYFIQCKRAKYVPVNRLKKELTELKEKIFPPIPNVKIIIAYSRNRKVVMEEV